jgi:hypothetical protein
MVGTNKIQGSSHAATFVNFAQKKPGDVIKASSSRIQFSGQHRNFAKAHKTFVDRILASLK